MNKIGVVFLLGIILLFNFSSASCAQEKDLPVVPSIEPDVQWVWAEAVSVDGPGKKITVKYTDYDTDMEKEMAISVDDQTAYENAQSLEQIQPQDTLSIDYIINKDGTYTARNISVEKMEALPGAEEGVVKEDLNPEALPPNQ